MSSILEVSPSEERPLKAEFTVDIYPLAERPAHSADPKALILLRTKSPERIATKHWKVGHDKPVRSYDKETYWQPFVAVPWDIIGLSALLKTIASDPRMMVVRGAVKQEAHGLTLVNRRIQDRGDDKAHFEEVPRHALMIDLDDAPAPKDFDWQQEPERAAKWAINQYLPKPFHGVTTYYQYSSSAGFKPGDKLRLHFWFWLNTPYDSRSLRAYFSGAGEHIDIAVYNPVQPHYTADPIVEGGPDPLAAGRSGLIEGDRAEVPLDPPKTSNHSVSDTPAAPSRGAGGWNGWWSMTRAEEALRCIDPSCQQKTSLEDRGPRMLWIKIVGALYNQFGRNEDTDELIDRWSSGELAQLPTPANYDPKVNRETTATIDETKYSMGSVHKLAVDAGWKPPQSPTASSTAIFTTDRADKDLAPEVHRALLQREQLEGGPRLFRFGDEIARIRNRRVEVLRGPALAQSINHLLDFLEKKQKRTTEIVPCNAPSSLITFIQESLPEQFILPPLKGAVQTPVLLADGTVQDQPGYSADTQLFHIPSVCLPPVAAEPITRDIEAARTLLLEVFCDMPFADDSDRAHALALLILPLVRNLIGGDTPGHLIARCRHRRYSHCCDSPPG